MASPGSSWLVGQLPWRCSRRGSGTWPGRQIVATPDAMHVIAVAQQSTEQYITAVSQVDGMS